MFAWGFAGLSHVIVFRVFIDEERLLRAGWVSMLLLEWLRNAVSPPGSRTHELVGCHSDPDGREPLADLGHAHKPSLLAGWSQPVLDLIEELGEVPAVNRAAGQLADRA